MFYHIFLSPQVKRCAVITYKHGIHNFSSSALRLVSNILWMIVGSSCSSAQPPLPPCQSRATGYASPHPTNPAAPPATHHSHKNGPTRALKPPYHGKCHYTMIKIHAKKDKIDLNGKVLESSNTESLSGIFLV